MSSNPAPDVPPAPQALDFFAVLLSGLCLVHCLALPALIAILPVLGATFLADERLHLWLLVAVLPTSLWAFAAGYRSHRNWQLVLLGLIGLFFISLAGLGRNFAGLSAQADRDFTVLGGLLLAAAHILNYRRLHALQHAACSPTPPLNT